MFGGSFSKQPNGVRKKVWTTKQNQPIISWVMSHGAKKKYRVSARIDFTPKKKSDQKLGFKSVV